MSWRTRSPQSDSPRLTASRSLLAFRSRKRSRRPSAWRLLRRRVTAPARVTHMLANPTSHPALSTKVLESPVRWRAATRLSPMTSAPDEAARTVVFRWLALLGRMSRHHLGSQQSRQVVASRRAAQAPASRPRLECNRDRKPPRGRGMVGLVPAERELAGVGVVDVGGAVPHVHDRTVGLTRVVHVVRDVAGANHAGGR